MGSALVEKQRERLEATLPAATVATTLQCARARARRWCVAFEAHHAKSFHSPMCRLRLSSVGRLSGLCLETRVFGGHSKLTMRKSTRAGVDEGIRLEAQGALPQQHPGEMILRSKSGFFLHKCFNLTKCTTQKLQYYVDDAFL